MSSIEKLYNDVGDIVQEIKATKLCTKCHERKPYDQFYKSARKNGLTYACRQCHRAAIKINKKTPGTYAYFYKRFEQLRRHAFKRGLTFDLTVVDYRAMKEQERCYYCNGITNVMSIDRVDNNIGYTKDNTKGACFQCNKVKSNLAFSIEEMRIIGSAIAMYHKRINLKYEQQKTAQ